MTDRRVLVTGSRSWAGRMVYATEPVAKPGAYIIYDALEKQAQLVPDGGTLVVVHGACPTGADFWAEAWATTPGLRRTPTPVAVEPHPAQWEAECAPDCPNDFAGTHRRERDGVAYCPWAGFRRNEEMAEVGADVCLAFIRGDSPGTRDMVRRARQHRIPVELTEARR